MNYERSVKLLKIAKIEYVTPFLGLWITCSSWYKEKYEDTPFSTDRKYIDQIKKRSPIFHVFEKLMKDNDKEFLNYLLSFYTQLNTGVLVLRKKEEEQEKAFNYDKQIELKHENGKTEKIQVIFFKSKEKTEWNYEDYGEIKENELYYDKEYIDGLFSYTFEFIYIVRNNLVHTEKNIFDKEFLKILEASYNILYTLLDKVLEN